MKSDSKKAQSIYRQARLTFTVELSGRVSYSISHKRLNAPWTQRDTVVRDEITIRDLPRSTEDVYLILHELLCEQLLPGHSHIC